MIRILFHSTLFFALIFVAKPSLAAWNIFTKKREHLHVVGSSTVSPLMTSVAEEFARSQSLKNNLIKTPVVDSTGTHLGFKSFCEGVGLKYPDFVDASRPIEESQIADCRQNGVKEIVEIKIGYDGIVFGNSIKAKKMKLSTEQIFLALVEKVYDKKSKKFVDNPYRFWDQIDPKLPATEILVYGPPHSSGTRDAFSELVMEHACLDRPEFLAAFPDFSIRKEHCTAIRQDGKFVETGENDNLLIKNLSNYRNAMGIFGFNFLIANSLTVQAAKIDGIMPSFETIGLKKYELSRPLFVYFKKDHLKLIPEMREFIREVISPETIGRKGYLLHNGLIALNDTELEEVRRNVELQLKSEAE